MNGTAIAREKTLATFSAPNAKVATNRTNKVRSRSLPTSRLTPSSVPWSNSRPGETFRQIGANVVLPQLQAAAQKLHPLGGEVEIRQYGRTGKTLRPASVAFRITDQQDQQDQSGYGRGHQSRAYLIVPRGGVVTVTCGDGFDVTGQPKQPKNVSEEIGMQ